MFFLQGMLGLVQRGKSQQDDSMRAMRMTKVGRRVMACHRTCGGGRHDACASQETDHSTKWVEDSFKHMLQCKGRENTKPCIRRDCDGSSLLDGSQHTTARVRVCEMMREG